MCVWYENNTAKQRSHKNAANYTLANKCEANIKKIQRIAALEYALRCLKWEGEMYTFSENDEARYKDASGARQFYCGRCQKRCIEGLFNFAGFVVCVRE